MPPRIPVGGLSSHELTSSSQKLSVVSSGQSGCHGSICRNSILTDCENVKTGKGESHHDTLENQTSFDPITLKNDTATINKGTYFRKENDRRKFARKIMSQQGETRERAIDVPVVGLVHTKKDLESKKRIQIKHDEKSLDSDRGSNSIVMPKDAAGFSAAGGGIGSCGPSALYTGGYGQQGFGGVGNYTPSSLLMSNSIGGFGYGGGYGYGGGMYGGYSGPIGDHTFGASGGGINTVIYNINQFLFGIQAIALSFGQAVHIISTNADSVQRIVEAFSTMIDHAIAVWYEAQAIEYAAREDESEQDKKRRRRLRTIRWAFIGLASYAGYNILLKKWLWRYVFVSRKKRLNSSAPNQFS